VETLRDTPTEPSDYATLTAGFGALLGALLLAARRRDGDEVLSANEIAPIGLAAFALSKLITKEKVESWVREPFVEERPGGEQRPKGRRLRYAVGELLTCTRCAGAWSALGLVALRVTHPREARVVNTVLGVSAANDFLHSAFALLSARAGAHQGEPEDAPLEGQSAPPEGDGAPHEGDAGPTPLRSTRSRAARAGG